MQKASLRCFNLPKVQREFCQRATNQQKENWGIFQVFPLRISIWSNVRTATVYWKCIGGNGEESIWRFRKKWKITKYSLFFFVSHFFHKFFHRFLNPFFNNIPPLSTEFFTYFFSQIFHQFINGFFPRVFNQFFSQTFSPIFPKKLRFFTISLLKKLIPALHLAHVTNIKHAVVMVWIRNKIRERVKKCFGPLP